MHDEISQRDRTTMILQVPVKTMNASKINKSFSDDAALRLFRGMIAITSNGPRTFVSRRKTLNKSRAFFYLLPARSPLGGSGD